MRAVATACAGGASAFTCATGDAEEAGWAREEGLKKLKPERRKSEFEVAERLNLNHAAVQTALQQRLPTLGCN